MTHDTSQMTLVLGGGPAGLTAGYLLGQADRSALVFEADDQVGGIAKTVERDGYRFDLGGHRFFTKSIEVDTLWHEVLGDEFLRRPRMSRIYWNNRYLDYPLRGPDVIRKLGPVELTRCMASYGRAALRRHKVDDSLEDWVSNRFGRRLFELFFKSYTEKVWGVPTTEIRAEWAAQRIKGLSFFSAAKAAFFGNKNEVKSLISEFNYPRFGPGQMWEAMRSAIVEQGGEVRLDARVESMELTGDRLTSVVVGGETFESPEAVISSLPLREVVEMISPAAPEKVLAAARGLRYRDFLTVALVLDGADPFPDNWIYIHEPGVRVGRIQNFRSWSPWMVPDPDKACVGLEYFCFAGDDLWSMDDDGLVALAADELERLRLAPASRVDRGFAIRVPKAYPIYDADYAERVETIRGWLDGIENLQQVGRNGLHRYNNSDHSMLTAMRAVDNLLTGAHHDIWAVNAESVYHETDVPDEHPYRTAPETPELQALATSHTE
ncbi:MAG TPA: NAD(P)/FAD-dependent oxidoreductase [Gaiellaceae bacterium]|nr:NAD(P)/FAD-dependent oxidoreductase [Gaiellaceae bacterium]